MPLLFEDPGVNEFRGLNLRSLKVDQAWLVLNSALKQPAWLYARSDDCDKCAFKLLGSVDPQSNTSLAVNTKHGWTLRLRSANLTELVPANETDNNQILCQLYASMGQFGVYDVHLNDVGDNTATNCTLSTAKEPVDIYAPLLACFLFFLILAVLWICACQLAHRGYFDGILRKLKLKNNKREVDENVNLPTLPTTSDARKLPAPAKSTSSRLKSLDTFRGISIVLMIFVNDGGGSYWFFEHATWNGLLVADLVFAWFLWIMGVCMPIAIRSAHRRKESFASILANIIRRSCLLFLLGLILNSNGVGFKPETFRIPGVLQRFAITYLFVGIIGLLMTPKDLAPPSGSTRGRIAFHDVIVLWPQWLVMGVVVAAHCLITFFLPVPNCPVGYIGPGGLHLDGQYPKECIGGAAGYIDRWLLTSNHIYNWPTAREVYDSGPYDPEGILGSLLSIFNVFLGVQAGVTLLVFPGWTSRLKRWLVWAGITGALGALLCLGSQNDGWIPVNKNLWSLSYVLVTSCFSFILLAACFFLIDVKGWWNGAPFFYPGMNGILMYVGHQIAYILFPWHWQSGPMNTHFEKLVETLWGVSLWVLIATWLYYKKFFLAL